MDNLAIHKLSENKKNTMGLYLPTSIKQNLKDKFDKPCYIIGTKQNFKEILKCSEYTSPKLTKFFTTQTQI